MTDWIIAGITRKITTLLRQGMGIRGPGSATRGAGFRSISDVKAATAESTIKQPIC